MQSAVLVLLHPVALFVVPHDDSSRQKGDFEAIIVIVVQVAEAVLDNSETVFVVFINLSIVGIAPEG